MFQKYLPLLAVLQPLFIDFTYFWTRVHYSVLCINLFVCLVRVPIHNHFFFCCQTANGGVWFLARTYPWNVPVYPFQLGLPGHLPLFQGSPKRLWGRGRLEAFFLRADPVEETCQAKIDFDHPTDVEWILRPESERSCRSWICGSWWWAKRFYH